MGFLDLLFGKSKNICPACGTRGARASDLPVRCPNPECQYFDGSLGRVFPGAWVRRPRRSDYSPTRSIAIRYRNFQGKEKTFTADRESLRRKRNHIVARLAPTGESIALSRDRIQNLSDVEQALPQGQQARSQEGSTKEQQPTKRERQVLAFHKRNKSTSPLYEQIRAKYPKW